MIYISTGDYRKNRKVIRIESHDFYLTLYIDGWFPVSKVKLKRLLDTMKEYDDDGMLPDILTELITIISDKHTFDLHPNREKDTFKRMINRNLRDMIEYGGKL